jgi:hypothetical protein
VATGGDATPPRTPSASRSPAKTPATNGKASKSKDWASSHGTGDRSGAWGLSGTLGQYVSVGGTLLLIAITPIFAILM